MIKAYCEFHRLNYAHSFEAYDENGVLAGGLYGISVGKIFCGESMFFRVSGASKFAFVKMAEKLGSMGVKIIDTQMVTNATAAFGAHEIPAAEYLKLLRIYGGKPLDFSALRG
jgi:leucyl/phenylalanyl-tRNA--protein transferase